MDGGSDSDDDTIAQQAALASAKFGNIQKKNPMMNQEKKKFDSADYFQEHEQLKNAAGLGDKPEEQKKE